MQLLSEAYWNKRYADSETGWDLGSVSPPLKIYFDQLKGKDKAILIPGAGNAHEAEYLHSNGFTEVHIVEFAELAMRSFMSRVPTFPFRNLHLQNFFDLRGRFDVIIEQTFFCALDPQKRVAYRDKMYELLQPNGILVGLLFNIPLNQDHPPFGGDKDTYIKLFSTHFDIIEMGICPTSIKPRAGNELFFKMRKATKKTNS